MVENDLNHPKYVFLDTFDGFVQKCTFWPLSFGVPVKSVQKGVFGDDHPLIGPWFEGLSNWGVENFLTRTPQNGSQIDPKSPKYVFLGSF